MLLATLVHHIILTFIAISLNVNYWTAKKTDSIKEEDGRFIFVKDLETSEVKIIEKIFALIFGIAYILVTVWLIALFSFTCYLRANNLTAYQYKQKKSVKFNKVMNQQISKVMEENSDSDGRVRSGHVKVQEKFEDLDSSKLHFLGIGSGAAEDDTKEDFYSKGSKEKLSANTKENNLPPIQKERRLSIKKVKNQYDSVIERTAEKLV